MLVEKLNYEISTYMFTYFTSMHGKIAFMIPSVFVAYYVTTLIGIINASNEGLTIPLGEYTSFIILSSIRKDYKLTFVLFMFTLKVNMTSIIS